MSKIFGIGFHKTGTTSLGAALEKLGYRVCGTVGGKDPDIARNVRSLIHSLVPQYDAFQDNPWPLFYEDFDRRYPGSRFILTVRSPETWIDSVVAHFGEHDTPMRYYIYGVGHPKGHEEIFLERYRHHNDKVRRYFRNRPEDLLILDITQGDGWDEICSFLGRDRPGIEFPRLNTKGNWLGRGW